MKKKISQVFHLIYRIPYLSFWLVARGVRDGNMKATSWSVLKAWFTGLCSTLDALERVPEVVLRTNYDRAFNRENLKQLDKMHHVICGLHSLLPEDSLYRYSFLLVVDKPDKKRLEIAIKSILRQTAVKMELLIGLCGPQDDAVMDILNCILDKKPSNVHLFPFPSGNQAAIGNSLVEQTTGNILVIVGQEGILRSDLTYRFEQTFRLASKPERTVVCNRIESKLYYGTTLPFPLYFETETPTCVAIPKEVWNEVGGYRVDYEEAHLYDILLRLDLLGIPLKLTHTSFYRDNKDEETGSKHIQAFSEYLSKKGLLWKVERGLVVGTLRGIPELSKRPSVHVIIPYKDQKKLTLAAVQSLQRQVGVDLHITAVDNRSQDMTIGEELEGMKVEVIRIDEPFNFSRLNNLAVKKSVQGKKCDLLFFMNNDVELHGDQAILELCRWIEQPKVGMVGCKLSYPNGLLQHGGMDIDLNGPAYRINCIHSEYFKRCEDQFYAKTLRVVDAVTGAAILIKRSTFLDVGGFDEVWFPNGHSDTNLAVKLEMKGLCSFYTPYASGCHNESMSRLVIHFQEEYEGLQAINADFIAAQRRGIG